MWAKEAYFVQFSMKNAEFLKYLADVLAKIYYQNSQKIL